MPRICRAIFSTMVFAKIGKNAATKVNLPFPERCPVLYASDFQGHFFNHGFREKSAKQKQYLRCSSPKSVLKVKRNTFAFSAQIYLREAPKEKFRSFSGSPPLRYSGDPPKRVLDLKRKTFVFSAQICLREAPKENFALFR